MKVLVTGSNGQLGQELQVTKSQAIELVAVDIDQLDICDQVQVPKFLQQIKPDVVINAAAYTAVDKAEQETKLAYAVNAEGAANLASASQEMGARMIHVSTDFVFDGTQSTPYKPADPVNPHSVYGASKAKGEQLVLDTTQGEALVIRTAWVYSAFGNNFVKTMLRLMSERDELSVVADQIGTPTWARGLAEAIWRMVEHHNKLKGIFHWTDAGVASWYDFAISIQQIAYAKGMLSRKIPVLPISTAQYPLPANRPAFSVLDKSATWATIGSVAPHWSVSLEMMLEQCCHQRK